MKEENSGIKIAVFEPISAGLAVLRGKMKDVPDATSKAGYNVIKDNLKSYRELKSKVTAVHKKEKAESLEYGRSVDRVKNDILKEVEEIFEPHKEAKTKEDDRQAEEARLRAEADAKYLSDIKQRIDDIKQTYINAISLPSGDVKEMILTTESIDIGEHAFGDYAPEAEAVKSAIMGKLKDLHATKVTQEETESKLKKAQTELDEREAKQKAEDAERKKKQDAEDKERNEALAKDNAEMKAKMAKMEAKEKEQEAKQKKIDDEQELIETKAKKLKEEEARILKEKQEQHQEEIDKSLRLMKQVVFDMDESEDPEVCQDVLDEKLSDPSGHGDFYEDQLGSSVKTYKTCLKLCNDKIKNKRKYKKEREAEKAEAEKQAKKESTARLEELTSALEKHICSSPEVDTLIDAIEHNEIPYLKIDWTVK